MADKGKEGNRWHLGYLGAGIGAALSAFGYALHRRHAEHQKQSQPLRPEETIPISPPQPPAQPPKRRLPGELYVAEPNDPGDSPN